MSSFIGGICYGNIRQQSLYSSARNILEKEQKAIDKVREDIIEAEAIELAKGIFYPSFPLLLLLYSSDD